MKSNRHEVEASELDEAGLGVGVAGDRRIHVVDLLPGERAEVAIDHHSPHKAEAWGHIVRRIGDKSTQRVRPACIAFGQCGGCTWQHLDYPAQLLEKHRRVELALADVLAIAHPGTTVAPVRPSPGFLGYRNKGKYVAGRSGDHLVLGAYAPRSHHVIDTLGCRVVAPVIDEVATWIRGAAEEALLFPYDEKARTGDLRYAIVREVGGDVLVALIVSPNAPQGKLDRVANALSKHPAVRGVVAILNDRRDGAIVPTGSLSQVLFGHGTLIEHIAGVPIEVGAGEFLQVNRSQAAAMYARVAELAEVKPGMNTVDLFAGLGGIGIHLARAGAKVVAVEIDRDAIAQLRRAANMANLPLTTVAADAGDLPDTLRAQLGVRPELVVVNPPRKGLSAGALDLIIDLAPKTVLYVSCGPEALGRDLVALAAHGWVPDVIEPFDLMPGTAQVETVVRLRR